MSDQIPSANYPSLKTEYLEILPNLSNKILYQEIPTSLPNLRVEEKAVFLHTILKTFVEDNSLDETKFRINYLDDDTAPQAFRQISPEFSWVRSNQYSLLALVNFVPELLSNPTTNTRSSTAEIRDGLKAVIEKVEHKAICDIMKLANPTDTRDPLDQFIALSKVISKALFLSIAKLHQGIVLNYQIFVLEAGIIGLNASYSQLVLGISGKEEVLQEARDLHQICQNMMQAYTDYLSLNNPNRVAFLKTIIP